MEDILGYLVGIYLLESLLHACTCICMCNYRCVYVFNMIENYGLCLNFKNATVKDTLPLIFDKIPLWL